MRRLKLLNGTRLFKRNFRPNDTAVDVENFSRAVVTENDG